MTTSDRNPVDQAKSPIPGDSATTSTSASGESAAQATLRRLKNSNTVWIFAVLVVAVLVFTGQAQGRFNTVDNFRNMLVDASSLMLLAAGSTYVIITSGIDLSVGSVLVFSGVMGAKTMSWLGGGAASGWGIVLAGLVASLVAGGAWGVLNGFLVAKAKVPALVATLGSLGAALGIADIITNGVDVSDVPTLLNTSIGNGQVAGVPWLVIIAAAITIALALVLAYTRFGKYTYAIGSNAEAARRAGISVSAHLIKVYALSGLLAGTAGFLNLARFTTTTVGGHTADNLNAIAAVVIGGTSLFGGVGTILGTAIGVFIPTVLQDGFVIVGVQPYWEAVAVGAVLVLAVYIDQVRRSSRQKG